MVSNAAKVEGINAFDDASAAARPSALVTSVAWTTVTANTSISDGGAVASEDYARAHDVVLQSRRVGSSGIEAWDAAGSVDSSDKLHPAGKHGPIEAACGRGLGRVGGLKRRNELDCPNQEARHSCLAGEDRQECLPS